MYPEPPKYNQITEITTYYTYVQLFKDSCKMFIVSRINVDNMIAWLMNEMEHSLG